MKTPGTNLQASRNGMTIMGVISIVCGTFAMLAPGLTGFSIAVLLGVLVLIAGVVRMVWAFQASSFLRGIVAFVIGALTLAAGVLLISEPLLASGVVTIMLAIYFIADGAFELIAAFERRPLYGWGWLLFGGVVSLLLGFIIWAQFPLSGIWAMGILVGIKLFMIGLIMITSAAVVGELSSGRPAH